MPQLQGNKNGSFAQREKPSGATIRLHKRIGLDLFLLNLGRLYRIEREQDQDSDSYNRLLMALPMLRQTSI